MIGIELTFTLGHKEWFDPVDRDEFHSMQTDDEFVIDNGYFVYNVPKAQVKSVREYQLCDVCGGEVGIWSHSDSECKPDATAQESE